MRQPPKYQKPPAQILDPIQNTLQSRYKHRRPQHRPRCDTDASRPCHTYLAHLKP